MKELIIFTLESAVISTLVYLYLHKKTRISLQFLYSDNVIAILLSVVLFLASRLLVPHEYHWIYYILSPGFVLGFAFMLTMIRFWRTPNRKVTASDREIISPADGNIIYITKVEAGEVPIAEKRGLKASLHEVAQTDLLHTPCWLIGINMTPFDVHKNCSPIDGKIILNKHIPGQFLSLKDPMAIARNERNTLVVRNEELTLGIVQTASRLVRRIDSYVKEGEDINRGKWFGMIRFGSQVDVILPQSYQPAVELGQQVYAAKSILARK
jgi:phosphatidylserine decarboxylase